MKHDPWNDAPGFWQAEATRVTDNLITERMKNKQLIHELNTQRHVGYVMTILAIMGWTLFVVVGAMVPA